MKLRSFRDSDIPRVDEIWKTFHRNNFGVPNRKNALIDAVVEDGSGKVIAYGQVKMFAETMLVLDLGASKRDKIQAVILLMHEAFRGIRLAGLQDVYSFIQDPDFADLISKHFDFERVDDPGELLLRRM